ncbi:acyltransferase [Pedobacter gandavensis]|uniref:Acyltransferase n=1 Tax=Pedobacter gandavensis TaxID=2679963 RepID=A0ABR6EX87_9SPHI|nr:acyltransferase [Pedobacter gandavensis]MBB2149898.1 acyltransferase [Pedobacter gandavensis]
MIRVISLCFYYGIFRFLPTSSFPYLGPTSMRLRYLCAKNIFAYCGSNVNVERGAWFGSGRGVKIGANSGIGINAVVPNNIIIGSNVMMGPNVEILVRDHLFNRVDIPMIQQGFTASKQCIIEDDVWIGMNVLILPGRTIKTGSIIAAGTILTKDFPEYAVVGGNPGKFLKSRKS